MLPVDRGRGPPRGPADHPDRGARAAVALGQLVQQPLGGRPLALVAFGRVHRGLIPPLRQVDGVEPGQLHAQAAVHHRVAVAAQPVQVGHQVGGRVAQEDDRLAQRAGQVDQVGQPPPPVGGGRVARVGPRAPGQQGRRLDQDQVGAGAFQHERRVVRQQLLGGGVRSQRGAAGVGQHARHDQPVAQVLVVGPGRRGPGQAGHRVAGQEPVTGRPRPRVLQDLGPAGLVLGAEAAVHGARRRPHRAAFPPHFVQVLGQPGAADPRALGRGHDDLAQLQGGGALHRHQL